MTTAALKISLLAFLAAYAIGGLATEILLPGREKSAIPLFSWFLFASVPNRMQVYAVRILEYPGGAPDSSAPFTQTTAAFASPSSPKGRELIQRIGKRVAAGDSTAADELRRRFERVFLPPGVHYQIVRLEYDPLARWRTGALTTVPLQAFTVGQP